MTDFLKIAKSIVVHFAHICAYGVETVKEHHIRSSRGVDIQTPQTAVLKHPIFNSVCVCACD